MAVRQYEPTQRAVEILRPGYGSGYRIGGRLVITAAHLVGQPGVTCAVRWRGTADDAAWEVDDARCVWAPTDPNTGPDVALVELPPEVANVDSAMLGRVPERGTGWIPFNMYGWPAWAQTLQEVAVSKVGGRDVSGRLYPAGRPLDGLLVLEPDRLPGAPVSAEQGSPWEGLSGAAVVCDGLVVAVLYRHQRPDRPGSLEATALASCVDDADFREQLSLHGVPLTFPEARSPDVEVDVSNIFPTFNESARRAVDHADHLRQRLSRNHVHMEHLIAGLQENPRGPTRRLLNSLNIPATELAELLQKTDDSPPIPIDAEYEERFPPPTALPPLSGHAEAAISAAWRLSQNRQSTVLTARDLLHGALSVTECSVIQRLAQRGITPNLAPGEDRPALAGFQSDDPNGEDRLKIMPDVRALASVLAAKDIHPPLSLGLFGDWGSGKSFFMHKMEAYIDELKMLARGTAGDHSAFCPNIVQLRFNAWHYIDTENLWATLASEVFERLAQALEEDEALRPAGVDLDATRARLLGARRSSSDVLADAERKREAAQAEFLKSEQRLRQLEDDEEHIREKLKPKLIAQEALRFVAANREVNDKLLEAGRELGLPASQAADTDLQARFLALEGSTKRVKALWLSLQERPGRTMWIALVVAVIVALLVIEGITFAREQWGSIGAVTAGIAALLSILGPIWKKTNAAINLISDAQSLSKQQIENEKVKTQEEREIERKRIRQLVVDAKEQVASAERMVQSIDRQLLELRADHQVMQFIMERHRSGDYRSHLGVIAHAREDFERLSELLRRARDHPIESADPVLPQIDRIILYIDDLDRCPEDKVVQVLQSVHLLLAFPLFVVVVGVDARWLLHSLRQHSAVFQGVVMGAGTIGTATEEQAHWKATPLNYLEKIFQIPFTLEPMDAEGFGALVDDLTRDTVASEDDTAPIVRGADPSFDSTPPTDTSDVGAEDAVLAGPATVTGDIGPVNGGPTHVDLNPQFLKVEQVEREYMKQLAGLIPSPRVAKRFVNVYRLLKASIEPERLETFIDDESGGEYRVVMLLLAMSAGYPAEASDLLVALMERDHPETWSEFVHSLAPSGNWKAGAGDDPANEMLPKKSRTQSDQEGPSNGKTPEADGIESSAPQVTSPEQRRRSELIEKLEILTATFGDDQPCAPFAKWARNVARFSFLARPVLVARPTMNVAGEQD